jgi:hypothetical protein
LRRRRRHNRDQGRLCVVSGGCTARSPCVCTPDARICRLPFETKAEVTEVIYDPSTLVVRPVRVDLTGDSSGEDAERVEQRVDLTRDEDVLMIDRNPAGSALNQAFIEGDSDDETSEIGDGMEEDEAEVY